MPEKFFQIFSKIRNIFAFLCRGIYEERKISSYRQVNDRPNGTNRHDLFEESERNLLKYELTAQRHRDM